MTIKEKITQDIKDAMRSKNTIRLETVRSINGAIVNFEKANPGKEVDLSKVLKQLGNQRVQAIEAFTAGGAKDKADQEQEELVIIQEYIDAFLPKQMSDAETLAAVDAMGNEFGGSFKDVGKIMGALKKKYGTSIDMQKANIIVKSLNK